MCEVHKTFAEPVEEHKIKPAYKVLLQKIEESCKVILSLRALGYGFDIPAMAAEKAYLFQILDIIERTEEIQINIFDVCRELAYHMKRMPSPIAEIIEYTIDRIWIYNGSPPSAKKEE